MRKKIVLLLVGLLLLAAVPAFPMYCEAGHLFYWNGREYCNPGESQNGCLRCWEEIVVSP